MSFVVTPFEVASQALPEPAKVRFVHLYSGIATRHSDTIDCTFRVNGHPVMVSMPCPTLTELREREAKYLRDRQLAEIAVLFLKRTLESAYDPTLAELRMSAADLKALARELGYL